MDRHVATVATGNRLPGNLPALVHEALVRCDPETADGLEEAALTTRGVWFDYRSGDSTATSRLTATLDTLDALDLDTTLAQLATSMGRLGDTASYDVRRAHALGMLAHPQRTLDVFADPHDPHTTPLTDPPAEGEGVEGAGSGSVPTRTGRVPNGGQGWWNRTSATLYLHLDATDLAAHVGDGDTAVAGRVEQLGAATLELLRTWLTRSRHVTIRPVLDPTTLTPVDQHDPPPAMREAVILRDGHCVFPGCPIDARRCDLDHLTAYRDPDHGGPPGQTAMTNLAALCRRHHRLKTFTGWTYHRLDTGPHPGPGPDPGTTGDYHWTSPHGTTLVTTSTPKH